MNLLAVSGSLRAVSSNTSLLRALIALAPPGVTIRLADPLDRLPHFNPDLDTEDPPAPIRAWREELAAAAGVIFCSPEYAHGIPGTLKNALDWDVSSGRLYRKPVLLVNASPYPRLASGIATRGQASTNAPSAPLWEARGQAALLQVLGAMQARVVNTISVAVGKGTFNSEGRLVDAETAWALGGGLKELAGVVNSG